MVTKGMEVCSVWLIGRPDNGITLDERRENVENLRSLVMRRNGKWRLVGRHAKRDRAPLLLCDRWRRAQKIRVLSLHSRKRPSCNTAQQDGINAHHSQQGLLRVQIKCFAHFCGFNRAVLPTSNFPFSSSDTCIFRLSTLACTTKLSCDRRAANTR